MVSGYRQILRNYGTIFLSPNQDLLFVCHVNDVNFLRVSILFRQHDVGNQLSFQEARQNFLHSELF